MQWNRDLSEAIDFTCDIRSFEGYELIEHIVLANDDLKASNSALSQQVEPKISTTTKAENGTLLTKLEKASWNVIRLGKKL